LFLFFIYLFFIYLVDENLFIYFLFILGDNLFFTKFWVPTSFRLFGDRYDELEHDSFTKSYQESEIFLMVKFETV